MPYIDPEKREKKNIVVTALVENKVNSITLLYALFHFCADHIKPSYNNYKNFRGEILECKEEIERRMEEGALRKDMVIEDMSDAKPEDRQKAMQNVINVMLEAEVKVDGDLNYILFCFCKYYIADKAVFCEVLRLLASRHYMGWLIANYEKKKIAENGDV